MGVQLGLTASWQRARQRQAFAGLHSQRRPRATFYRLFLEEIVARRGLCFIPVLAALGLLLLVPAWQAGIIRLPDLGGQLQRAVQQQIDAEDAALCQKFGFAPATPAHTGCKLDLAELRHRHEQLLAAYDLP